MTPIASLRRVLRAGSLLVLAAAAMPLTGCSRNAATGDLVLTMFSRDQMAQVGAEAAPQFTAEFGGAVADPQLQSYVTDVGRRMAAKTEADYPSVDWEFTLLDSSVVNAFALPGGKVFITRGLASRLGDEAELAGVLGHEIGHVTAQHGNRRMSKQGLFTGSLSAVQAVLAGTAEDSNARAIGDLTIPALQVGGSLVLLKYGRDEELEADALGVRYMARAGYDPAGQARVMQTLADLSGGQRQTVVDSFLASHPDAGMRAERVREMVAAGIDEGPLRADGRFAPKYRRTMLDRLASLPPAAHTGASALTPAEAAILAGALGAGCPQCAAAATPPSEGPSTPTPTSFPASAPDHAAD